MCTLLCWCYLVRVFLGDDATRYTTCGRAYSDLAICAKFAEIPPVRLCSGGVGSFAPCAGMR